MSGVASAKLTFYKLNGNGFSIPCLPSFPVAAPLHTSAEVRKDLGSADSNSNGELLPWEDGHQIRAYGTDILRIWI